MVKTLYSILHRSLDLTLIEQLNDTSIIFDTIGIETILTIMGIEEVEEVYLLGESQADMFSKMKNFSISCQSI